MPRALVLFLLLLPALGCWAAASGLVLPAARADDEEAEPESPLDYACYKARVAPILHRVCAECHANPRKRSKVGRFFLRPAPGRRIRERYHERNFEAVSALVEPNNPAASLLTAQGDRDARRRGDARGRHAA